MSTTQKALVFIVLVLALLVGAVELVLFAQKTNWKAQATTLDKELKDAKANIATLERENAQRADADKSRILEIETRAASLEANLGNTAGLLTNTEAERGMLASLVEGVKSEVHVLKNSVESVTLRMQELQVSKDAAEKALLETKSALSTAEEQLVMANRRNQTLNAQIDSMSEQVASGEEQVRTLEQRIQVLQAYAPNLGPAAVVPVRKPVFGRVTGMTGDGSTVYLSVGVDDGVKEGMELMVYRGSSYLGKVRVFEISSDKSAARVMQPTYGTITEGANVTN